MQLFYAPNSNSDAAQAQRACQHHMDARRTRTDRHLLRPGARPRLRRHALLSASQESFELVGKILREDVFVAGSELDD